jgi:hypothetical protein
MKKPWLAFILNFLLAGAGLAYLGMWAWGVVNLIGVVLLGIGLTEIVPASQLDWVYIALPVINGVLAQSLAQSRNAKLKLQQAQSPSTGANT